MKTCPGSSLVDLLHCLWIDSRGIGRSERRQRSEGVGVRKNSGLHHCDRGCRFLRTGHHIQPPPKVVWLRRWDYPTAVAEQLLRSNALRVSEFVQDSEQGL